MFRMTPRQHGNRGSSEAIGHSGGRLRRPKSSVELEKTGHVTSRDRKVQPEGIEPVQLAGGERRVAFIEPERNPHPDRVVENQVGQLMPQDLVRVSRIGPNHHGTSRWKGEAGSPGRPSLSHQVRCSFLPPNYDQTEGTDVPSTQTKPLVWCRGGFRQTEPQAQVGPAGDDDDLAEASPLEIGWRGLLEQDQEERERETSSPLAVRSRSSWQAFAQGVRRLAAPLVQVAFASSRAPASH